MNPYMKKEDILKKHYMVIDTLDPNGVWELLFLEGGKRERVFEYYSWNEAQNLWEEDALMHWMKTLRRTWDDEDFKDGS